MAVKKDPNFSYEDYDYEDLCTYAGIDCIVTYDLFRKLMPEIRGMPSFKTIAPDGTRLLVKAPSVLKEQIDVKANAQELAIHMEVSGIKYDVELAKHLDVRMRNEMRDLEQVVFAAIGEVNLDSDKELAKALYTEIGMEPQLFTKTGAPSTSGDALELLQKAYGHEWLNSLIKRNDIRSVHSAFITKYLEKWVKPDGRVHPGYNLFGTSSHRISSSNP